MGITRGNVDDNAWDFIKRARNEISDLQREHDFTYRQAMACTVCLEHLSHESLLWWNPASPRHRHDSLRQTVGHFVRHLAGEMSAAGFLWRGLPLPPEEEAGVLLTHWMKSKESGETLAKLFRGPENLDRFRPAVEKAMYHIAKKYKKRRFRLVNDEFLTEVQSILQTDSPLGIYRLHDDQTLDYNDFVIRNILEKHLEEICETPGATGEGADGLIERAALAVEDVQVALDVIEGMTRWATAEGPPMSALLDATRSRVSGGGKSITDKTLRSRFSLTRDSLAALKSRFFAEVRRRLDDRASA